EDVLAVADGLDPGAVGVVHGLVPGGDVLAGGAQVALGAGAVGGGEPLGGVVVEVVALGHVEAVGAGGDGQGGVERQRLGGDEAVALAAGEAGGEVDAEPEALGLGIGA